MPPENAVPEPVKAADAKKGRATTQFPKPPFSQVRDTDRGRNAHKLFTYWMNLGKEPLVNGQAGEKMTEVAEIRIYRCWPVIDLFKVDPGRKNIVFEFVYGPCPFKDPHAYPEFFLKKFGAGDWKVVLLEAGVAGPVMQAVFRARGMEGATEDLDAYPPKLDYRTLVNCDENTSYINWRSRNGLPLPWDETLDEFGEVSEMPMSVTSGPGGGGGGMGTVVGDAIRTLAESNGRLTDRAIESSEKLMDAKLENVTARLNNNEEPSASAIAQNESIKLVTDTARSMVNMVTENSGKQYDPVELLRTTAEILGPKKGDDGMAGLDRILNIVQASNDRVIEMYSKQAQLMETLVMKRNGEGSYGPGVQSTEKPKTFSEQLNEFRSTADTLGFARPGASAVGAAAVAAAPDKPSWFNEHTAPIVIMGFQTVMVLVANIVHNWAAVKFKAGQPVKPEDALAQAQNVMNQQQAQPADSPAAHDPAAEERAGWQTFIEEFTGPFINHLFTEGCNGYTLALFLQSDGTMAAMTQNGRKNYMALKNRLGPQGFETLCRGHQPLWSKCGGHPHVRRFIQEFMNFDEHQDQLRREGTKLPLSTTAA